MLPVVTRSAEVVLHLVPDSLREAALALGAPRWRVVFRIVLPTALPGLVTGSLLAVARARGRDRAAAVHRAFAVNATTFDLGEQMNSLPIQIFNDVGQAQDRLVERAWGAALTLVAMILLLTLVARLIQRRSRLVMSDRATATPRDADRPSTDVTQPTPTVTPSRRAPSGEPPRRAAERGAHGHARATCTPTTATTHAVKGVDARRSRRTR